MQIYRAVKYLRLSEQDGDKQESESIENQRDIIDNFINNNDDLKAVGEYIDDGYTGGNFDRPDFKRMIQDIEDGKIDCIITKDLSRFGRDHIDTGYYLERYLPSKAIRYIAIGDGVDTINARGLQFLSFKLSYNDYYIQDISKKIKSVKKKKMENGEYQAGIAPYGYKKDENIKNHLVIDENVYKVVQEIFDMYGNKGMSTIKIADELNRRNIVPPAVYMNMPCTKRKCKNPSGEYVWLRTTIGNMLKNQTYLGYVVSGKREQISPKIKKGRQKKKEEFIVIKNMHDPIIDEELWKKVQARFNSFNTDNKKKYNYILKGMVYCGECGNEATFMHSISKNKSGKVYWEGNYAICKKRNDYIRLCENKILGEHIILRELKKVIQNELNKIDITSKEIKETYKKAKVKSDTREKKNKLIIESKNKELKEIENRFSELYKRKLKNEISIDDFNKIYEGMKNKRKSINQEIKELENEITNAQSKKLEDKEYKEIRKIAKKFLKMEEPDRETIEALVRKITFDKNKNITIELTFSNPYEKVIYKKDIA